MKIEQIGAYGYGIQVAKAKQRENSDEAEKRRGKANFSRHDTYEPSNGSVVIGKASSLGEVKSRVESNFYNSETVNEDLTEVFSKLLDR